MNYIVAIAITIISFYLWASAWYYFLNSKHGKNTELKTQYLREHFDRFSAIPLGQSLIVNEKTIKKSGDGGWTFAMLALIVMCFISENFFDSQPFGKSDYIVIVLAQGCLFMGGHILSSSWLGVKFLKELNIEGYDKETFEKHSK